MKKQPEPLIADCPMTVGQLREYLRRYPKDGEVWIETREGNSSWVKEIWPLNQSDVVLVPISKK